MRGIRDRVEISIEKNINTHKSTNTIEGFYMKITTTSSTFYRHRKIFLNATPKPTPQTTRKPPSLTKNRILEDIITHTRIPSNKNPKILRFSLKNLISK